jgi:hypothetical protein
LLIVRGTKQDERTQCTPTEARRSGAPGEQPCAPSFSDSYLSQPETLSSRALRSLGGQQNSGFVQKSTNILIVILRPLFDAQICCELERYRLTIWDPKVSTDGSTLSKRRSQPTALRELTAMSRLTIDDLVRTSGAAAKVLAPCLNGDCAFDLHSCERRQSADSDQLGGAWLRRQHRGIRLGLSALIYENDSFTRSIAGCDRFFTSGPSTDQGLKSIRS